LLVHPKPARIQATFVNSNSSAARDAVIALPLSRKISEQSQTCDADGRDGALRRPSRSECVILLRGHRSAVPYQLRACGRVRIRAHKADRASRSSDSTTGSGPIVSE
jgi:hypothetical protein